MGLEETLWNKEGELSSIVYGFVCPYIHAYIHTYIHTFFMDLFVQGRWQPTQSQLIQIYSVDWRDVYDTHNIEHRTEPVSH